VQTEHVTAVGDARDLALADDSTDLVVTSPPYPMIELWDDLFADLDPAIGDHLDAGDGDAAFEAMHAALAPAWDELARVLKPGGIACINVGDATRSVDDEFQQYPNHAVVIEAMRERGFRSLPDILWRKPVNRRTKFMGSGMVPTNAYTTLEHEYILVFRNGSTREFPPGERRRYESAYFWEERNEWFSDLWTLTGTDQALDGEGRDRSGAFPLQLPLRLVTMYSVYGDHVLDPFWGTGTTTLAAMLAGRNSVGFDRDPALLTGFDDHIADLEKRSRSYVEGRLDRHREFVAEREAAGKDLGYDAEQYDFPVVTNQERRIRLYAVENVRPTVSGYAVEHAPFEP
jgi:site-specific DNA-methyltransferase (adenine-specific)